MNLPTAVLFLLFALFPFDSRAEWMSDVDKKYAQRSPGLYGNVKQAKDLLTSYSGRSEDLYRANALLQEVVEKDPNIAPAYVQLARLMSRSGYRGNNMVGSEELRAQEQYLQRALALEPKYDYAIAMMGYNQMYQGNLQEAERYYSLVASMKSGYPYLKSQMAQLAFRKGDYKKALKLATEGYEQNRSDPPVAVSAINEIIFAYERIPGSEKEIDRWQRKRIELEPDVAWHWGNYARFRLISMGDYERAIEYASKALSLMDYGVARYHLAAAYYTKWATLKDDKARQAEAAEALKKAAELHPDSTGMAQQFIGNPRLKAAGEAMLAMEDAKRRNR